jgi:hypothetical protein
MSNQTEKANEAFAELKEASDLRGYYWPLQGNDREEVLIVLGATMTIKHGSDYSVDVEYEIRSGDLFSILDHDTKPYDEVRRMIHDSK